jgi:hypothetical protein
LIAILRYFVLFVVLYCCSFASSSHLISLRSPLEDLETQVKALVRLSLSNCVEGNSYWQYERQAAGWAMGFEQLTGRMPLCRLGTRKFAMEVEFLAARILEQLDAHCFNMKLPGIGLPSDFHLTMDGVGIGFGQFTRNETLLMICFGYVSPHTGKLCAPMLSAPVMYLGSHTGAVLKSLVLAACRDHPVALGVLAMPRRLACTGGDGQMVRAGPDARHSSSAAAERIWNEVHDDPDLKCTVWDNFHRVDNATMRAVRNVPIAEEVFKVGRILENEFGYGEGSSLFRGVCDFLGDAWHAVKGTGGNRKVVYHAGTPGNILQNFRAYSVGFHCKIEWKRQGHGKKGLRERVEEARRLTDVSFLVFCLLFNDILVSVVRPYALIVQACAEPGEVSLAEERMFRTIDVMLAAVEGARIMNRVLALCRQHCVGDEFRPYLTAMMSSRSCLWAQTFKSFAAAAPELYSGHPPRWCGVLLGTQGQMDRSSQAVLGPHCQCLAMEEIYTHHDWQKKPRGPTDDSANLIARCKYPRAPLTTLPEESLHKPGTFFGKFNNLRWPLWTKSPSSNCSAQATLKSPPTNLADVGPRLQWRPVGRPRHPFLPADRWKGAFQRNLTATSKSRCEVPRTVYEFHEEVEGALVQARIFLVHLKGELTGILGSIGSNLGMSALLKASVKSFEWKCLLYQNPTGEHINAFRFVLQQLRPFLEKTLWPDDEDNKS